MRISTLAAALLLAITSLVAVGATTTTAEAAAKCWHNECTGKGPMAQNCDHSGSKLRQRKVWLPSGNWGPAQLMYSSGCHSYWARGKSVNTGQVGNGNGNYWVKIVRRNKNTHNVTYKDKAHIRSDDGGAYNWTLMAGATSTSQTKACGKPESTGKWVCTKWFHHTDSQPCAASAQTAPGTSRDSAPRRSGNAVVPC